MISEIAGYLENRGDLAEYSGHFTAHSPSGNVSYKFDMHVMSASISGKKFFGWQDIEIEPNFFMYSLDDRRRGASKREKAEISDMLRVEVRKLIFGILSYDLYNPSIENSTTGTINPFSESGEYPKLIKKKFRLKLDGENESPDSRLLSVPGPESLLAGTRFGERCVRNN